MASDLKLDLVMMTSQQDPNVQLMGNPAVLCSEGAGSVAYLLLSSFTNIIYFHQKRATGTLPTRPPPPLTNPPPFIV